MNEEAEEVCEKINVGDRNYKKLFGIFIHPCFQPIMVSLFNNPRQTEDSLGKQTVIPGDQLEACLAWLEGARMVRHSLHYRTGKKIWSLTKIPKLILNQARWRLASWRTLGEFLDPLPEETVVVSQTWIQAQTVRFTEGAPQVMGGEEENAD